MIDKRKLKLVIFDCDGVLFNSEEANRRYYDELLHRLGLPAMTEEELSYCHAHTAAESIKYLLRNNPHLIVRAENEIPKIDYADFLKFMNFEPEVPETVSAIHRIYPTAISTNRSTTMPLLVKMYNLNEYFDKIVCALDVNRPKPDPEGVFQILNEFGVKPDEALYVGDTYVDEQVSQNSGVPLIAYKNSNLDAVFHVEHFSELKDLLI